MQRIDRLVVSGSLAFSLVALAVAWSGPTTPVAVGGAPFNADLGPADALLLADGGGKDPLRVASKDGRIAWGDRGTSRAWSVAAVDVDKVMKKILEGSSYSVKRDEMREKLEKTEAEFEKRAAEIQSKFPIPPGGQPPAEGQQAFRQLEQEYRAFQESFTAETQKLTADQFESAYRELVVAVESVADKESIDLVYRFATTADPFEAKTSGEAVDRIRARTFLKYPAQIDITEDVMKALNLG